MTSPRPTPPSSPTESRHGRPGELLHRHVQTAVGRLELIAAPTGLRAVLWPEEDGSRVQRALTWLGGRPAGADPRSAQAAATTLHLDAAEAQLEQYFAGTRREFDLTLDPQGTPFQLRVWQALQAIPFGQTRTYADQARALGQPGAARAVGAADGRNPLSIVVPCHRVLGASGSLTGFAGGVRTKSWLLQHEAAVCGAPV